MIKVCFKGILKDFAPGKKEIHYIEYEDGVTLGDVLSILETDQGQVGVIIINGEVINNPEYRLGKRAIVEIFPVFGGG